MTKQAIVRTPYVVSRIVYGCMGLGGGWGDAPEPGFSQAADTAAVRAALDAGIDFFDHANIYARGRAEESFSTIWKERPSLRDSVVVQTKCGIIFADKAAGLPQRYDFSSTHIQRSVEESLRRLKTDYVDILLLHRPDALVEPEEVADAFDRLHFAGKARYFGVSNLSGAQIDLLKTCVTQPLVVNQVEMNVVHAQLLNAGITTDQREDLRAVQLEGTLEYCRINRITIQAWSPLAHGAFARALNPAGGRPPADSRFRAAAELATGIGKKKGVGMDAILLAWIMRHPAKIQPVIGTVKPERISESCKADGVELSREEWYALSTAGRGAPMP